jgi:uroporphyrinogen decarboxylase
MKINMTNWLEDIKKAHYKKAMPILSFPAVQIMGISVKDLISSSDNQARAMKCVADRVDTLASVSLMDLSVEAECFGSKIIFSENEVPTVFGSIVSSYKNADELAVPKVGAGRTGIYADALRKATNLINDRPILGGVIGPFSLAGRLLDVSKAMIYCYDEPEMVHLLLKKTSSFITEYCKSYKTAGANGVIIAEPLAGLLSPALADEFSSHYVKEIVRAVQDQNFIVIYHNCGNSTIQSIDSILSTGASAYHFGNAIKMSEMMKYIPSHTVALGNVDPAGQLRNGTPESVRKTTLDLLHECGRYPNFVISSGCDIPPLSKWENIDAFFTAVKDYYGNT